MITKSLCLTITIVTLLPFWLSQAASCPEHCFAKYCNSQGQCGSCSGPWWGLTCSNPCPAHCWTGQCDMKTGQCGSCSGPWWGPTCSNACPKNCWTGQCDMKTGQCSSCSGPWWGPTCSNACPKNCWTGQCDMKTGKCGSCSGSWWGPTCENPCPEHCWTRQCDMKTGCCGSCTDGYSGSCTCSIPPQCANPQGINCDWYSTCLSSAAKDCPIIQDIMGAKCQEYHDLEPSLSPTGAKWSQYVRSCIQKELANNVLIPAPSGSVDCQKATDTFFGKHLGCYLNGPIPFCKLPYGDITKILMHGASILFTKHWYDPLVTGAQLKYACDLDFWETALQDHSTKGRVLLSGLSPCANASASLVSLVNQRLAPQNWTVNFESAKNVTDSEGTSVLLLSSLNSPKYPLNITLAANLAVGAMREWQANNTQCSLTFNGQNIGSGEQRIVV